MQRNNNAAIIEISQVANQFRASIVLQYDNKYIDAKSILGLYTTLIHSGEYSLHVHGPDAAEAKAALVEVFEKYEMDYNFVEE
jgi:phosphocarrier protein